MERAWGREALPSEAGVGERRETPSARFAGLGGWGGAWLEIVALRRLDINARARGSSGQLLSRWRPAAFPARTKHTWEKGVGLLGQNLRSPVTPAPGQMAKMSDVGQKGFWGTGRTPHLKGETTTQTFLQCNCL